MRERASKGEWTGSSGRLAIIGFESAKVRAFSKRVAVGTLQYNELLGLAKSGVSAINFTQTATQVAQGKSTFTKTVSGVDANGNPVSTSTEQTVQNVNFSTNNFYRAFSDNPVVTEAAASLPQMQRAGLVRDLREAMSLGTGQAVALQASLEAVKTAGSAQAHQTLLDSLIGQRGATSSLAEAKVRTPDAGMSYLMPPECDPSPRAVFNRIGAF